MLKVVGLPLARRWVCHGRPIRLPSFLRTFPARLCLAISESNCRCEFLFDAPVSPNLPVALKERCQYAANAAPLFGRQAANPRQPNVVVGKRFARCPVVTNHQEVGAVLERAQVPGIAQMIAPKKWHPGIRPRAAHFVASNRHPDPAELHGRSDTLTPGCRAAPV